MRFFIVFWGDFLGPAGTVVLALISNMLGSLGQRSGVGKYILLGPKEATARVTSLAPQFESKTSLFCLSH
jgi:hypothetical protein